MILLLGEAYPEKKSEIRGERDGISVQKRENGGATITPLQPTNANIWRRQKGTRLPCACRVAVAAGSVQKLVVVVTGQQAQETLEHRPYGRDSPGSVGRAS